MAISPITELFSKVGGAVKRAVSDDARLTHDLDELLRKAQEARRPYEGQWLLNLSFYFNKQWVIFSQALGTLDKPQVDAWRVMPNINFVGPAIITTYAKVVQSRQTARTQPGGTSPDDEKDARACDKLLDYLEPTAKAEEARAKAAQWMLITGTGLLKDCWDKSLGVVVAQDPESGDDIHEGEIQEYPISPFEFYGEPGCLEIDEMEWCFHVTLRPASYVKKMWGIDVDESEYDDSMTYETQLRSIISGEGGKEKGCVVKEFFRRPTKDHPGGQYVVYVNDTIVEEGTDEQTGEEKNPYDEVPLPFTKMVANPRPGSFWGLSFVDNMIDPQRIYNKTKGEALEIQRLMSKPKWKIPIGSMPEGKQITNAPGEDVRYLPVSGLAPDTIKGEDIPEGFHKMIETTRSELYDASGQHEVSQGQSPFTRTATGIAYLQEADDARLAPIIRSYDRAFELSSEAKLKLARQYYAEPRLLHLVGPDNKTEIVSFMRDMIPNNINVHILAGGQALPRSRVARQDFLLKLWVLPRPIIDDPKVMLDLLEFGEIDGVYENMKQDINQAGRENDVLIGQEGVPGQLVKPRDFHNHLVHIKEHNKVRNSLQYEELQVEQQVPMDAHVMLHQQMYQQQVLTMQQNLAGEMAGREAAVKGKGSAPTHPQPPAAPTPSGLGHLFEQTAPDGGPGPANGGGV